MGEKPLPDQPTVTIVTPSYNQGEFLEETILSVLNQDYPRIEYLIIDGGSTDGSVEIIRRYEDRLAYWVSEPDRGQSHAINKGFQRANGKILGWLNSDDVYCPGAVRAAVDFFEMHPDVAVMYGRADVIDSDGDILLPFAWEDFDAPACITRARCVIPQPAAFFRRDVVQRVGLLDERLKYSLDWDYWIRVALAGLKISGMPQVLARMRLHPEAKTVRDLLDLYKEMVTWVDRFFSQPLPPGIAALERKSRSRALLNLGRQHFYAHQYTSARRAVLRGIRHYPPNLLRERACLLFALSMLPGPAITLALRLKRLWFGFPPALETRERAVRVA
jgi:glycosyltransferase involved in cell wall biosynthesis